MFVLSTSSKNKRNKAPFCPLLSGLWFRIRSQHLDSKSLPIIFISYNWLPNSRCIELIFLNSNSFFCIPQCSMEENCLAPEAYRLRHESPNFSMESRRLLRFTTSIQNIGDADFRPFIPKTAWEWHACHMHYHSMEVSMNAFLHIYHTGSFIKKNSQIDSINSCNTSKKLLF